jgi:transposase
VPPEIERIRRENEDLRRQIAERDREIADQQQELLEKQRQIQDLERKLQAHNRNSTNSSKPPSSDGLAGAQRVRSRQQLQRRRRRKPGGQPGHPGHHRPLVPIEQVNVVETLLPEQCQRCGEPLVGQSPEEMREPRRHQVTEIPKVQAFITEYQRPEVKCGHCGQGNYAPLPSWVRGEFGPQLTALIAYWTVVCRMPRRVVEALLAEVLGIKMSLGSTQKAWEEVSTAVRTPYEELQQQLPQEAVLNIDETGWRNNGKKRWLWGLVAQQFVFYAIAAHRNAAVLVALLGAVFRGIIVSDRFSVYLSYPCRSLQLCWAHLKRNLIGLTQTRSPRSQQLGRDALALVARLFRLWHGFRGDLRDRRGHPQPLDRAQLIARSVPLQKKMFHLAQAHLDDADAEARNLAKALFVHAQHLYTFLEEEGVEPTNNRVERALRIAVQWRKISFGNRSDRGESATARLLTVTQTCKLQGISVLTYLTQAVVCHRRGLPTASLLPKSL